MDNKIYNYRKENPKCGYCKYINYNIFSGTGRCKAKDKIIFPLLEKYIAKKCRLYEASDEL